MDTGISIKNRMPRGIKSRATPPIGDPLKQSDWDYLARRAVSREYALSAGWHRSGNRIGIPVRDERGVIVNVRRHLPPPRVATAPKTIHTKGQGSPTRLAGIERIGATGWVFIAGGEFDTAAAVSAGLNAVNGTNGEGSVPHAEYLEPLRGRRVAVALDADDAGRADTDGWVDALLLVAAEVRVVELPEGTDVNDWFVAGNTADALIALAEAAPVRGNSPRRDSNELLQMALEKTEEGQGRDDTGIWLACQLRDERYTRDEAWAVLQAYQQAVEHDKEPPYTAIAARVNLDSAWSREPRSPSTRRQKSPTGSPRTDGWASSGTTEDSSARRELVIVKASDVKSARQRFLWEGRIPLGILALLGGRGGVGKSTFALWLAVELQHGRLPGDFHGKPMPFLYVGIEDDWETQVKPRLQAAGADMDLALFVKVTETVDESTGDRVPDLAQDMPLIEAALAEYGPCLMIVDPLPSLIQDDDHRRNVVRAALDPLLLIMAKTQSTVFGIMHTKKGGGAANDLLSGSHAYYDASRAVLLFAKDDESGHVIMSQAKGNYASDETTGSLAYRLVSTPVELDDYTVQDYARVEIVGESKLSVEEIVNRDPLREDVGARARWIVDYLSHRNGRAAQADIVAAADDENGWSERQLKAARAKCSPRVESKKQTGVMNGPWFWCLEGVEPPSAEESDADTQESSAIPEEDQPTALKEKSVSSADSSVRKRGIRIKTTP